MADVAYCIIFAGKMRMLMLKELFLAGAGGFVGSALRYGLSLATLSKLPFRTSLPFATLAANLVGALLIGVIVGSGLRGHWYSLLAAGFCGGFTTFSTFSLELFRMLGDGYYSGAAAYLAISLLGGLACVYFGFVLGRLI